MSRWVDGLMVIRNEPMPAHRNLGVGECSSIFNSIKKPPSNDGGFLLYFYLVYLTKATFCETVLFAKVIFTM